MVELVPTKPMCVELVDEYPPLGRLIIRDGTKIVGVGTIQKVNKE